MLVPGVRRASSPHGHGRARGGDASGLGGEAAAERVGPDRCAGGRAGEREATLGGVADVARVQLARRVGGWHIQVRDV